MTTKTAPQTIASFLAEPLRVGEPDVVGPLTVFPLFGPEPKLEYKSFAQARTAGFRIGELEGGASVNDLLVENPTDQAVLLFDGEEVIGAQQNRTFDVSVLVGAETKLRVPVSCVEAGRWQGSRHSEEFEVAPQAAYPELRRRKAARTRAMVASGMEARANQQEVWEEVASKADRMATRSQTGAMHDIFEQRRGRLAEMSDAISFQSEQLGALAAINDKFIVLDLVGRPDVFESLHGPLVQGYALDALEHEAAADSKPPTEETARGFTLLVSDCAAGQHNAGVGLGEELRFAANGVEGSALVNDGELVQLTAFPATTDEPGQARAVESRRVRRPSQRR